MKHNNKKDYKCFQYPATVELNYEKIGKDPERITKCKPFIDKYKWEGMNYSSEKDDWKIDWWIWKHSWKIIYNKVGEYIPLGFLMTTILSFKSIENKHDVFGGKDCMQKFVNP